MKNPLDLNQVNTAVDFVQMRLESIEAVNKIVEEANKRIQPTGTGNNLH